MKSTRFHMDFPWFWITFLTAVKLLVHLFTNTRYELHRDEYLYIAESAHLDFGFVSVPPFTALMAKATHLLLGDSAFAYRFFPSLIGAATVVMVGWMVLELGGKSLAVVTACLALLMSIPYLRVNSMLQPVSFDVFFWVLSCAVALRMLKTNRPDHWLLLGTVWGLAFLNKYAIAFFVAAFLIALALTPQRKLFASRHVWTAAAVGLVLILPNLVWQMKHNWPVVHHMRELQRTQLVHVSLLNFISDQLVMNFHAVAFWASGLIGFLFLKRERTYRPLGLTVLICLGFLILARGKSYYTLGLYPVLFAAGACLIGNGLKGRWTVLHYILIAFMAIALPLAPYGLPLLKHDAMARFAKVSSRFIGNAPLRWETGRIHQLPQDYADMTGWKELAGLVNQAFQKLTDAEKNTCVIYAGNYGEAGAIRYYGRASGLPEPVSFSDNFLLWTPDSLNCSRLIHVDEDTSDVRQYFESVVLIGTVTNPYAREYGLPVLLCSGLSEPLKKHYRQEREERLKTYRLKPANQSGIPKTPKFADVFLD